MTCVFISKSVSLNMYIACTLRDFLHERYYLNLAAFLRMVVFFKILGFFIKVVFFFEF